MTRHRSVAAGVLVLGVLALAGTAAAHPLPEAPRCEIFPADNHWNLRVDRLPVHRRSAAIVRSIGRGDSLVPGFSSGSYGGSRVGIPITVVSGRQRRVRVRFEYARQSDRVRYPIPRRVPVEGGRHGDRHVIIVDRDRCRLYELFAAHPLRGEAGWRAGSGAVFDLGSNRLRPRGWTSADAAGLPILPGLARYDEVRRGVIDHALRISVPRTRRAYVYPARHFASNHTGRNLPAMGQRLRLRRGVRIANFPRQARVVLRALRRYGAIVADNGPPWHVSGAPHRGWNDRALASLRRIEGSDFEVVDTSRLPRPR